MPLLDAALAFALTMLALSTVVSMVAGMVTSVFHMRRRGLQRLLDEFFQREVVAALRTEAARLDGERAEAGPVDTGTAPAASAASRAEPTDGLAATLRQECDPLAAAGTAVRAVVDEQRLDHLGTAELRRVLLDTDAGRRLRSALGARLDEVLDELGERWEDLGRRSSRRYRRKMRWWTTAIGALLAFALNVDSAFLAATYLASPVAREAATTQLGAALDRARSAEPPGATADVGDEIRAAREQLALLRSAGLPIGWAYFPGCADGLLSEGRDARCVGPTGADRWLLWLFGCLATALLAGLGAPFWYDLVLGLASTAERVRRAPGDDDTDVAKGRAVAVRAGGS